MKLYQLVTALACGILASPLASPAPSPAPAANWKLSLPGWSYEFPRDHWSHSDFKTEWWYFTGKLKTREGREFGYQVTFFRQGVRPSDAETTVTSRFVVHSFAFGHAALTDLKSRRFRFGQKLARGAFGEAGFAAPANGGGKVAWLESWRLDLDPDGNYTVIADIEGARLNLTFNALKPWTIHGEGGVSQKAAGEGRASHYYSGTRLRTEGTLQVDGADLAVTGESWFDHEWASNQLTPEQVGWNWFSIQLNDGSELMLYQMRLRNGALDPYSSGTFVDTQGQATHLKLEDYTAEPVRYWISPATKARYPVAWRVHVPKLGIVLAVTTPMEQQELNLDPVAYWEGLIQVDGSREEAPVAGHGYMELTGYAGALVGLSSPDPAAHQ
jgi:predicted secreted hydrolase